MPKGKGDYIKCNERGTRVDTYSALVFEIQNLPDYPDAKEIRPQSEQMTAYSV